MGLSGIMIEYHMKCIFCGNEKLYRLKSGQLKCSSCGRKFSPQKIQRDLKAIECFCKNLTVAQASKLLELNYTTVKKRYEKIRELIAQFLEQEYQNTKVIEYDEYIYLQRSKKKTKENIFDAQDFLTFHYDNKVYNLLMPNLNRYKDQFLADGAEEIYFKEFSKFMMFNKISKIQKKQNIITQFWEFFEDFILKYKGVDRKNFFYYLKEAEFKFNYTQEEQRDILQRLKLGG